MAGTSSSTHIFFDDKTRSWQQRNNLDDAALFANNLREGVNVIFTKSEPILENPNAKDQWSSKLGIPDAFWSTTSFRHNGYFGCSTFPYNKRKTLTRYDTMFRLIVKKLPPENEPERYEWLETSYFSSWTDNGNLLICFNSPEYFAKQFVATLNARSSYTSETLNKPYAFHVILMDSLVSIYDQSIWDLSKRIRDIEKNRKHIIDKGFPGLHEVARHAAHATETAQVAGTVIERMVSECEVLAQRQNDDDAEQAMYERLEALRMYHSMMLGIAARSTSNEKRLSNEINLLFNTMAQKDNGVNLEIARATKADSVAMKTIAIVTLTFLPATYVSALLGMNLFSYNPDVDGGHITYSPDLWLYFIISILLTAAVLTTWWVWQRRVEMVKNSENQTEEAAKRAETKTPSLKAT